MGKGLSAHEVPEVTALPGVEKSALLYLRSHGGWDAEPPGACSPRPPQLCLCCWKEVVTATLTLHSPSPRKWPTLASWHETQNKDVRDLPSLPQKKPNHGSNLSSSEL